MSQPSPQRPMKVAIVGKHPHAGCQGWVEMDGDKPKEEALAAGIRMCRVRLDPEHLGVQECFADANQLRRVALRTFPTPRRRR